MIRSGVWLREDINFAAVDRNTKVNVVRMLLVIFALFFLLSSCSNINSSPNGGDVNTAGADGGAPSEFAVLDSLRQPINTFYYARIYNEAASSCIFCLCG